MTPEERLLRDMWMREMWSVCRGMEHEQRTVAKGVCKACGKAVERTGRPGRPREYCRYCRPLRRAG